MHCIMRHIWHMHGTAYGIYGILYSLLICIRLPGICETRKVANI